MGFAFDCVGCRERKVSRKVVNWKEGMKRGKDRKEGRKEERKNKRDKTLHSLRVPPLTHTCAIVAS